MTHAETDFQGIRSSSYDRIMLPLLRVLFAPSLGLDGPAPASPTGTSLHQVLQAISGAVDRVRKNARTINKIQDIAQDNLRQTRDSGALVEHFDLGARRLNQAVGLIS